MSKQKLKGQGYVGNVSVTQRYSKNKKKRVRNNVGQNTMAKIKFGFRLKFVDLVFFAILATYLKDNLIANIVLLMYVAIKTFYKEEE